ncbi:hypothetical protein ACTXT7_007529 [Hymenolepis weldensis]
MSFSTSTKDLEDYVKNLWNIDQRFVLVSFAKSNDTSITKLAVQTLDSRAVSSSSPYSSFNLSPFSIS